jgi:hypothetical protein
MEQNPYQAPASTVGQPAPQTPGYSVQGTGVSPNSVNLLAQTRPWWRFFSVLMFIAVAFGGIALLGALGNLAQVGMVGAILLPLVLGLFGLAMYLFIGIKLWSSANSANRLAQTNSVADLEAVLEQQRSLWKVMGILTIIFIVLYIIVIAIAGATFFGTGSAY